MKETAEIIIIGGGAAGMMAALSARKHCPEGRVILLEKNDKLGKKIFITGKGRGNLTNAGSVDTILENYVSNPRFLYPALGCFDNRDLMELMEKGGCRVKVERGDRVFPVSDHAYSITDCLRSALKKAGVEIRYSCEVRGLNTSAGRVTGVETSRGRIAADRVIVATGGMSYPSTGSTGDGYRFARELGMQVTELYPSLTGFLVEEPDFQQLRGLKLKNVSLDIRDEEGRSYYQDFGEVDFMSTMLEGPILLSASAHLTGKLNHPDLGKRPLLTIHLNLKPALTEKQLDDRLLRELEGAGKRELRSCFGELFPAQLIPVFLKRLERKGVDTGCRATELRKTDRGTIVSLIRDFPFTIRGTGGFREAIVTQGGVDVREINPSTMESRKVSGLYFAGEVLDIDAYTGGFNMQGAFSTGYLAGKSAALKESEK